jgi:hypothetical protein
VLTLGMWAAQIENIQAFGCVGPDSFTALIG